MRTPPPHPPPRSLFLPRQFKIQSRKLLSRRCPPPTPLQFLKHPCKFPHLPLHPPCASTLSNLPLPSRHLPRPPNLLPGRPPFRNPLSPTPLRSLFQLPSPRPVPKLQRPSKTQIFIIWFRHPFRSPLPPGQILPRRRWLFHPSLSRHRGLPVKQPFRSRNFPETLRPQFRRPSPKPFPKRFQLPKTNSDRNRLPTPSPPPAFPNPPLPQRLLPGRHPAPAEYSERPPPSWNPQSRHHLFTQPLQPLSPRLFPRPVSSLHQPRGAILFHNRLILLALFGHLFRPPRQSCRMHLPKPGKPLPALQFRILLPSRLSRPLFRRNFLWTFRKRLPSLRTHPTCNPFRNPAIPKLFQLPGLGLCRQWLPTQQEPLPPFPFHALLPSLSHRQRCPKPQTRLVPRQSRSRTAAPSPLPFRNLRFGKLLPQPFLWPALDSSFLPLRPSRPHPRPVLPANRPPLSPPLSSNPPRPPCGRIRPSHFPDPPFLPPARCLSPRRPPSLFHPSLPAPSCQIPSKPFPLLFPKRSRRSPLWPRLRQFPLFRPSAPFPSPCRWRAQARTNLPYSPLRRALMLPPTARSIHTLSSMAFSGPSPKPAWSSPGKNKHRLFHTPLHRTYRHLRREPCLGPLRQKNLPPRQSSPTFPHSRNPFRRCPHKPCRMSHRRLPLIPFCRPSPKPFPLPCRKLPRLRTLPDCRLYLNRSPVPSAKCLRRVPLRRWFLLPPRRFPRTLDRYRIPWCPPRPFLPRPPCRLLHGTNRRTFRMPFPEIPWKATLKPAPSLPRQLPPGPRPRLFLPRPFRLFP